jgi:biotin carboxylase
MKNEKILFISGGIWQKSFVKFLKNKGHFVAIVNPVETETTKMCDLHIKCDINDSKQIKKNIKIINPNIITSDQSDVSTKIVSELSEEFGLYGNPLSVIEKFSNKYEIFKFASKIKIPVPDSKIINNKEELIEFSKKSGFPFIIKPIDSTMSRGFKKINSGQEICDEMIKESLKFSKSKKIIAQYFIEGDMITCEGICSGGRHKTLATSIKISSDYFYPGITSRVTYPAKCPKEILDKIIKSNDKYIEKSGLVYGLTHSEYIFNKEEFKLIEIGARGGGAGISDKIVPWVSGVNNYEIFYKSMMGEIYDVKSIKTKKRHAILRYYKKEDVTKYQSDIIKNIEGVAIFYYNFSGTQYVHDENDCRYSMGIYLANDEEDMKAIKKKLMEQNIQL